MKNMYEIGNMIHDTTYHIYVSNENVILSIEIFAVILTRIIQYVDCEKVYDAILYLQNCLNYHNSSNEFDNNPIVTIL